MSDKNHESIIESEAGKLSFLWQPKKLLTAFFLMMDFQMKCRMWKNFVWKWNGGFLHDNRFFQLKRKMGNHSLFDFRIDKFGRTRFTRSCNKWFEKTALLKYKAKWSVLLCTNPFSNDLSTEHLYISCGQSVSNDVRYFYPL